MSYKTWIVTPLLITFVTPFCSANDATWFRNTPMQSTMEALLEKQPRRAWQELTLALSQSQIEPIHWQPVKEAILAQSNCGHQLDTSLSAMPPRLTLSFISRSGFSSSGYQIKVSTEETQQGGHFSLVTPQGISLLSGEIDPHKHYQEWETNELITSPEAGVYYLKYNRNELPVVVSRYDSNHWLNRSTMDSSQIQASLPQLNNGCAKPVVNLQWFDSEYNQVKDKKALEVTSKKITLEQLQPPSNARHLSASTLIFEYQPGVKIEYIHRISLPFSNRDK
ncbi:DUF2861 family protein [Vibrio tubiashii]|uniref:DUF2861 family protein n=1 Tax=Vibrio tubiashii TaxID=29498 RepID=UPI00349E947D